MEFEIVSGATDAIMTAAGTFRSTTGTSATSTSWQIEDVRLDGDVVSLDSALQSSYAEHV